MQNRISEECVFVESSDRWVRIRKRVLISAHLPTIKASLEDFNVPLHELEQLIRRFPDHEVIFGNRLPSPRFFSFEKRGGTWDHAPSLQSSRQKSKRERHLSLSFLTRTGLVLANTWGRENMIGEATKKPWHERTPRTH